MNDIEDIDACHGYTAHPGPRGGGPFYSPWSACKNRNEVSYDGTRPLVLQSHRIKTSSYVNSCVPKLPKAGNTEVYPANIGHMTRWYVWHGSHTFQ